MNIFAFHPLSNLFPLMEGEGFEDLCQDIEAYGLREPIVLYENEILDGRNRYLACLQIGVEPRFETFEGDDPFAYVISLNMARRHLNESQRASFADKIANMPHGGDRKAAYWRKIFVSQAEAAERLNISIRSLSHAHRVHKYGIPELQHAMDRGLIAVSAADEIAKLPSEEQAKFSEVFSGEKTFPQVQREEAAKRVVNITRQPSFEKLKNQSVSKVERLREITSRDENHLEAEAVVIDGLDYDSPFHSILEWDETEAANKWRLQQARGIIDSPKKSFKVPGTDKEVVSREYVENHAVGGTGYEPLSVVLADPVKRENLLAHAWKEILAIHRKYSTLEELAGVFAAAASFKQAMDDKLRARQAA